MSIHSAELNRHFETAQTHTDQFHAELEPKIAAMAAQYGLPVERLTQAIYGRWEAQLTARRDLREVSQELSNTPESLANLGFEMALLASIQKHGAVYQNGVEQLRTHQANTIQSILDGSLSQAA